MKSGVLLELELVLLVVCSLVAPAGAYAFLYGRWSISRRTVLGFAMLLMVLAGVDVALLQSLTEKARRTPDLPGMQLFTDQLALVLYVLPAALAGLGVNLLSHVLISHLGQAERRFDHQHSHATSTPHLQHWQTGLVMLAIGAIFLLDLYSGNDIRLHALYLFPLAWVARHRQGWLPTTLTLLTVSALQIVTFSLAAAGQWKQIQRVQPDIVATVKIQQKNSANRQHDKPRLPVLQMRRAGGMAVLMVKPPFGLPQMADQHMRKQIHPQAGQGCRQHIQHQGQLIGKQLHAGQVWRAPGFFGQRLQQRHVHPGQYHQQHGKAQHGSPRNRPATIQKSISPGGRHQRTHHQ
jgi:hypothetical protein